MPSALIQRTAAVLAMLVFAASAHAQDSDEDREPTIETRQVPNYDGREEAPLHGRHALWIPRLLVSPFYFLTEFVLRRPLGALTRLGEGSDSDPLRFFVYGDHDQIAIVPTLLIDFGNRPSVGAYLRWNEAGHRYHKIRLHFATWGRDWLKGRITDRWESERFLAEVRLSAQRRSDGRFAGLGSEANPGPKTSRYQFREFAGQLTLQANPWRATEVRADFGVRSMTFGPDSYEGPTIEQLIEQGVYSRAPPGYLEGYTIYYQRLELDLNTRRRLPHDTSGLEVRVDGTQAFDLQSLLRRRWVRLGANVAVHWDIRHNQVLALSASMQLTHAIQGEIPFTELPELGGSGPLPGFRFGTLIGESTSSLVLRYSWPIWAWLNATLHYGIGNVYDGKFEDFTIGNQRMGFGVGFSAVDNIDHVFNIILGWGTDTFENGPDVVSFRFSIGATWRI